MLNYDWFLIAAKEQITSLHSHSDKQLLVYLYTICCLERAEHCASIHLNV